MEINVLIEEGIETGPTPEWMQNIVETVLNEEGAPANVEISLVITGQERIQELNRDYRGKDQPTDVLSFSLSEQKADEAVNFIAPPDGLMHLGEVIISYPQALIQAAEASRSIEQEMAALIVHGVLHIRGYDHEKSDLAPLMKARENQILELLEKEWK